MAETPLGPRLDEETPAAPPAQGGAGRAVLRMLWTRFLPAMITLWLISVIVFGSTQMLGINIATPEGLERLWAESEEARIPKIMTFGKFKDEPVSKVDRGYANWYRRQPDPDPYLLEAFRRNGLI